MGQDGDIAESLSYVLGKEANGDDKLKNVSRVDRNHIAVYYLPARRDPDDHARSSTNSLLGKIVRAVNWEKEAKEYEDTVSDLQDLIEANPAIGVTSKSISENWAALHKGSHFKDASITFGADSLEKLIQNFSGQFSPAHASKDIDYSLLSDGQKSLLYPPPSFRHQPHCCGSARNTPPNRREFKRSVSKLWGLAGVGKLCLAWEI